MQMHAQMVPHERHFSGITFLECTAMVQNGLVSAYVTNKITGISFQASAVLITLNVISLTIAQMKIKHKLSQIPSTSNNFTPLNNSQYVASVVCAYVITLLVIFLGFSLDLAYDKLNLVDQCRYVEFDPTPTFTISGLLTLFVLSLAIPPIIDYRNDDKKISNLNEIIKDS